MPSHKLKAAVNRKRTKRQRNIGLILAGGIGARTKLSTPKQFLVVAGKPIVVYTAEVFNRTQQIDAIVIVVRKGWETVMERYVEEYSLDKVQQIVTGGPGGQDSIRNSIPALSDKYAPDDIIIIHDAVRPLVTEDIITTNISGVLQNGTAITVIPSTEALLYSEDWTTSNKEITRERIMRTQTPQSLRLEKLVWAHKEAEKRGVKNTVATCTLLVDLGETVHFVNGINSNFKITTRADIDLFEAYLHNKGIK